MTILLYVLAAIILVFGFVVFFGAPYVPTRKEQIEQIVKLLEDVDGRSFAELGAGSGAVSLEMARRGAVVTAYELNPVLAGVIYIRAKLKGLPVTVILGNFWRKDLSLHDDIYVFQMGKEMPKLRKKIDEELKPKSRVVSYAFKIKGLKPDKKLGPMYLYRF